MNENVDLVTLRVVVAAADLGSISAASHSLDLAVAAASARVSALEEYLAFKVFERSPRGVYLTPNGHMLVERARALLLDADRLSADLRDYGRGLQGHVRVLANSSSLLEVLPQVLRTFQAEFPLIQVQLDECGSPEVPVALLEGRADIGIVDLSTAPNGLEFFDFFDDTLVLVTPADHKLALLQHASLHDALDSDFIMLANATALSNRLTAAAAQAGKPIRIRMRMRSFDAVTRMVAAGLGVGVLPYEAVAPQRTVLPIKTVPLDDAWARRTHRIATRLGGYLSPASRKLLEALREYSRNSRAHSS
ncbi:LysR family transcriptional regulator [Paraburkholderia sp. C35]|uniref:LysR family transcriptional regulator n=1 Tax=Paraburkholderia sp. C35 TaxID=2126993 RepID=UPI000D687E6C|nr:LysR family transcriptional regulator [Paraburkholderia sp. C35]